jgi:hypothetical protein
MKSVLRTVAAAVISLSATFAAQASTLYDYSYTFGSGAKVTGSFDGDADGNIISNLSNITAYVDGVALSGSGSLYASHSTSNTFKGWSSGGGIVSFDGTENNFLFIDSNYPVDQFFTNFVFMIPYDGSNTNYAVASTENFNVLSIDFTSAGYTPYSSGRWAVTAVPEPTSVALLGLGLFGFAASRCKAAKK